MDDNVFSLNPNIIADYLGVQKKVIDTTYFGNVPTPSFHKFYLPEKEMVGTILKEGVKFKNPTKTKDHTRLQHVFWQILAKYAPSWSLE